MKKKEQTQITIGVIISMIIIVFAWIIWFYPANSTKISQQDKGFKNFAKDIINSLTIFQDKSEPQEQVNIDDLRERVFGDTIAR